MAEQYFCENQRRAGIIRNDAAITINGIDYLEVLDSESPVEELRQFTLVVRLLRPVPASLTPGNVRISGGVRVTPVGVEWVAAADSAPDLLSEGLISAGEAAYFSSLFEADHVLLVRTDSRGDFSNYTLHLVASPTADNPPDGFDAILSHVDFSFKVECPSPFDCADEEDCPPEIPTSPIIDYLSRDYNSFRQLLLDRLAVTNPQWQERHIPDLNITLVELLAHVGDYLSYWQDGAATEAYLDTARLRPSLRRHARLLAYNMHDGCNARTWVHFEVDDTADGVTLNAPQTVSDPPLCLLTRLPVGGTTVAESDLLEIESRYRPKVFELRTSVTLHEAHNAIPFHTWGDEECCLPAGATRATLLDDGLELSIGDVLIFEEIASPSTGAEADADPAHRHAVKITMLEMTSDPVLGVDVINIGWADDDALPFPLCLSARVDEELLHVSTARGNIALADHGRTQAREGLPLRTGHRLYRPILNQSPMTFAANIDPTWPAARMLVQDPRSALATLELEGDGLTWLPQRDLLDSDRFQPHVVAEMENDGRVKLRFGDDIYGRVPSDDAFNNPGSGAVYRTGNGSDGNIGAEALAHILTNQAGITAVRNPLPAVGGSDPEALEEVRQYAPQAFRRQERAVTEEDYAMVAERHPAVQRAVATRRWTGSWHTMFITIDRRGGLPVDALFESELRRFIERYRLAGHDLEIDAPRFVALDLRFTVCVKPGYFRSDVQQALLRRFSRHALADGTLGFFNPDNFTFGQTLYLSDVIAAAMSVTGVQWVDFAPGQDADHRFQRWGRLADGEFEAGKIKMERLEIARLDNDPSQPENGYIEFYMEGGL